MAAWLVCRRRDLRGAAYDAVEIGTYRQRSDLAGPRRRSERRETARNARYGSCLKALPASSFFSVNHCVKTALPGTLQADGAEDKALPGGNLSADSGAKTRLGFGVEPGPSNTIIAWDWHQSGKSQGSGDRVPRKRLSSLPLTLSSVPLARQCSALSSDSCLRPQLLHEPVPPDWVSQSLFSLIGLEP